MKLFQTIPLRAWALVLSSALLQVFIFPTGGPVSTFRCAFGWIALVPFLVALALPARDQRPLTIAQSLVLGYLCGMVWYLGNCYWIYQTMYLYGGLPKPVSFAILILFALYLGLYHALFAGCFSVIRRARPGAVGALIAAPFLWVTIELARGQITGFPWDLLGYSQVDNLWLTRLAPLAGVMALSFVLAAVNSAIASFFVVPGTRRSWLPLTAILLAVVLQLGTPLHRTDIHEAASQTAVMMQENLEVGEMARQARPLTLNQELDTFFGMSLAPVVEGTGSHRFQPPTVVIWPEAPSHFQSDDPAFRYAAMVLARTIDAPAILGSLGVDRSSQSERGYYLYDSASLFDATGRYRGRYDKIHLVPWGEYVPFQQVFAFAHKLTEGVGNMDRGTARSVFAAGGHSYGVFICYESIFGEEVRQFAQNGAQVLVNISDDGWYGDSGAPWQHLNMTRMRAIENHRWLLLDTNTGVTTSIDPQGREVVEAPRHVRGAYSFPFAFQSGTTLYTRWGDWFAWCCAFVSLVAISLCLSHKVSKP